MTALQQDGRTFDWSPQFDPRSLEYRAAARVRKLPTTGVLWQLGPVLDQGAEGACVGFGCAGAVAAAPSSRDGVDDAYAQAWYRRAQRLDQWAGEAYDGTSVLAGCLVGRERGLWTGFRWAKNTAELATGILDPELGPAIIGVQWSERLYDAPANGLLPADVELSPDMGHCVVVLGYVPGQLPPGSELERQLADAGLLEGWLAAAGVPVFVILNSWGTSWGANGLALVPEPLMRRWVDARGEFALPVARTAGQLVSAAQLEDDQPATARRDSTLTMRAMDVQQGDRFLDPPDSLGVDSTTVLDTPQVISGYTGLRARLRTTAGTFQLPAGEQVKVRRPRPE